MTVRVFMNRASVWLGLLGLQVGRVPMSPLLFFSMQGSLPVATSSPLIWYSTVRSTRGSVSVAGRSSLMVTSYRSSGVPTVRVVRVPFLVCSIQL